MNKKIESKYFAIGYFQKSFYLLYPLLGIQKNENLINTFLHWDEIEENILSYHLIVEYKKDTDVPESRYLEAVYYTDNDVYVYDMSEFKDDIENFLDGRYSLYSNKNKEVILKYYKWTTGNRASTVEEVKRNKQCSPKYHVILYPNEFKEEIAKELTETIFTDEYEALQVLKQMNELAPLFDLEKETLTKNIKHDD